LLVSILGIVVTPVGFAWGASSKADPSWSAARLATSSGLAAALGEPVTGVEDDGGFPASNGQTGQISAAKVVMQSGVVLDLTLYSLRSASEAKALYQQLSDGLSGGVPIAGAGDQSRYASGQSFLLKGAQVLDIAEDEGRTLRQLLNSDQLTVDPKTIVAEYAIYAQKAASPLATAMKGTPATTPALALPDGAVDPCLFTAKSFAKTLKVRTVTASYDASVNPPALTCQYSASDGTSIEMRSVTDTQLRAALTPSTVAATFAADQDAAASQYPNVKTGSNAAGQAFAAYDSAGNLAKIELEFENKLGPAIIWTGAQSTSNPKQICEAFFAKIDSDAKRWPVPENGVMAMADSDLARQLSDAVDECNKILGK
jgi:hypothetical protein